MISLEEVLKVAKVAGASDVHLTVGLPPKMRVNGSKCRFLLLKNLHHKS